MKRSDAAWLTLGAAVVAYDVFADDDDTLSAAVDRYLDRHPWLTRVVIMTVARHLSNELTSGLDPLALGLGLARRLRRRPVVVVVEAECA